MSLRLVGQQKYFFDFSGTLLEAIEALSKNQKLKFSYDDHLLSQYKLTKEIKADSDQELITKLLKNLPFKVQSTGDVYLIIPQKKAVKFPVYGEVLDKESGQPLPFAYVEIANKMVATDEQGKFSLSTSSDTIAVLVSYLGYKELEVNIPAEPSFVSLELEPDPVVLKEVILSARSNTSLPRDISSFDMNPDKFNALPTLGETDVFKTLQLLPGIQATDESSSGLFVRGGLSSQNLVLMDGITIYHLDHLFGIYATLNPNFIGHVRLHKGGFGAQYGGRVSSVIDITGRAASSDHFSGMIGMNFLSFNGLVESPVGAKTSLIIGFRRSLTDYVSTRLYQDFQSSSRNAYLETIDPAISNYSPTPDLSFYDFNGKVQHRFSARSLLDLNLYSSKDTYQGEFFDVDDFSELTIADQADWGNIGMSAVWKNHFHSNWFAHTMLSFSSYSDNELLSMEQDYFDGGVVINPASRDLEVVAYDSEINNAVEDLTFKTSHELDIDSIHTLKAGMEFNHLDISYRADQSLFTILSDDERSNEDNRSRASIASLYGSYRFEKHKIGADLGIRSTFYVPSRKVYMEPRLNLTFKVNDRFRIKAAGSVHHQYMNHTSLSFFRNDAKFYWILAGEDVPVLKSQHLIGGFNFSEKNWTVDVEYYHKKTRGVLENRFSPSASQIQGGGPFSRKDLAGTIHATGVDFFMKYKKRRFTSWVSYAFLNAENAFWYIDDGNPFPSDYSQRHEINWTAIFKVKNWEFSSLLIYGSGKPFSTPFIEGASLRYELNDLNSELLPAYIRFDAAVRYSFPLGKVKFESGITFFNVFNYQNIKWKRFVPRHITRSENSWVFSPTPTLFSFDTYLLGFTPNLFLNVRF